MRASPRAASLFLAIMSACGSGTLGRSVGSDAGVQRVLSLVVQGGGGGSLHAGEIECRDRCQASLPDQSHVIVTATPDDGSIFAGWAGACAFVLFVYLVLVSVLLHDFWSAPAASAGVLQTQFIKNMGIAGGLLLLGANGPGRWSLPLNASSRPARA